LGFVGLFSAALLPGLVRPLSNGPASLQLEKPKKVLV